MGGVFVDDGTKQAAAVAMVCTLIMWFLNFGALMGALNYQKRSPSDKKLFNLVDDEDDTATKFNVKERIAANQMEQWPITLAVFWGAILVGGNPTFLTFSMPAYVILRILWTLVFLGDLQPFRTILFLLSQFTTVASGIVGILGAFGIWSN
eukprot:CAMPEP_0179247288 /NCGR_PEP_ID=MMETSP0797-20121207/19531_1 /TAXON_ID=47934 /ORGANISM="Dinophysis acuminata, Strain DAEP01" /LENGTH=150 /DNA_ID=CAMNT_0020954901 /DNA_START=83 /DNA_END=535 /DNA_ORIENTATION=-